MMEVFFATKNENNKRREKEFLELSPSERLLNFFERICSPSHYSKSNDTIHPNEKKGNFILERNND